MKTKRLLRCGLERRRRRWTGEGKIQSAGGCVVAVTSVRRALRSFSSCLWSTLLELVAILCHRWAQNRDRMETWGWTGKQHEDPQQPSSRSWAPASLQTALCVLLQWQPYLLVLLTASCSRIHTEVFPWFGSFPNNSDRTSSFPEAELEMCNSFLTTSICSHSNYLMGSLLTWLKLYSKVGIQLPLPTIDLAAQCIPVIFKLIFLPLFPFPVKFYALLCSPGAETSLVLPACWFLAPPWLFTVISSASTGNLHHNCFAFLVFFLFWVLISYVLFIHRTNLV